MIGHYLNTLCADALGRILTTKMSPGSYLGPDSNGVGPCLVGTATGGNMHALAVHWRAIPTWRGKTVEGHYDDLCVRFGTARVNALIRARSLTILAGRAGLTPRASVAR
jgi:hypothetical protein